MRAADSAIHKKFIEAPSELIAACQGKVMPEKNEFQLQFPLPEVSTFLSHTLVLFKKDHDNHYYAVIDDNYNYPEHIPYAQRVDLSYQQELKRKVGVLVVSKDGNSFYKYEPGEVLLSTCIRNTELQDHIQYLSRFEKIAHLQFSGLAYYSVGKKYSSSFLMIKINSDSLNLEHKASEISQFTLSQKVGFAIRIVRAYYDQFVMNNYFHGSLEASDILISPSGICIYPKGNDSDIISDSLSYEKDLKELLKITCSLIASSVSDDLKENIINLFSNIETVENLLSTLVLISTSLDASKNQHQIEIAENAAIKTKKSLASLQDSSKYYDVLNNINSLYVALTELDEVQDSHEIFMEYLRALNFDTLYPTLRKFLQNYPDSNQVKMTDVYVDMLNEMMDETTLHLVNFYELDTMVTKSLEVLENISLPGYSELKDNLSRLKMSLAYQDYLISKCSLNFDDVNRLRHELIAVNNAAKAEYMGYVTQYDSTVGMVYHIYYSSFHFKPEELKVRGPVFKSMFSYLKESITDESLTNSSKAASPRRQKNLNDLLSVINQPYESDFELIDAIRGFLNKFPSGGFPFFVRSTLKDKVTEALKVSAIELKIQPAKISQPG